jgi:hypothetical protein
VAAVTEVTLEQLLTWSIERERHLKQITALKSDNALLEARLRLCEARLKRAYQIDFQRTG